MIEGGCVSARENRLREIQGQIKAAMGELGRLGRRQDDGGGAGRAVRQGDAAR